MQSRNELWAFIAHPCITVRKARFPCDGIGGSVVEPLPDNFKLFPHFTLQIVVRQKNAPRVIIEELLAEECRLLAEQPLMNRGHLMRLLANVKVNSIHAKTPRNLLDLCERERVQRVLTDQNPPYWDMQMPQRVPSSDC
jgi:hypothetical protein